MSDEANIPTQQWSRTKVIVYSFIVVPYFIALFGVILYAGLRLVVGSPPSVNSALATISRGSETERWQAALDLVSMLQSESFDTNQQFVDNLIHEYNRSTSERQSYLRTYLALAMGLAGALAEKQSEYVGYISKSSDTLLAIVDNILDLATIDAGVMKLDLKQVDVDDLFKDVADLIKDRLDEAGVTLECENPDGIAGFVADAKRVKQVLYHLLLNAIGFSGAGTVIALSSRRDGSDICLVVRDHGRGIKPEDQPLMFERFETKTAGSRHRGAGLGLTIVKSLVELHDGSVELQSVPGEGTTVTCRFPEQSAAVTTPELKSA